jgi:hypothetical protein
MVNVKSLMLGINGFSYGYFMRCKIPAITSLFNTSGRGVVYNNDFNIENAWSVIMEYNNGFNMPENINKSNTILINIPVKNPTYGIYSSNYKNIDYNTEISEVFKLIDKNIGKSPVIASINVLNRNFNMDEKCNIYSLIDSKIYNIINKLDEFIIFSPYGDYKSENSYEPYGVYISSRARPNPHKTVNISEIIKIFSEIIYL